MIRGGFGLALLMPIAALAAEGMWTLDQLPRAALERQYGTAPDAAWVGNAMKASVRLGGGCSGSLVSPEGLVLTNAHCVLDCVQAASSAKTDRVADGFLARDRDDELQCPALELDRLEEIVDITARIQEAGAGLSGQAFVDARRAARARAEAECLRQQPDTRHCEVVELYRGARFHLYRYHRIRDVRLAFVPEYAVAFFGGDADNFGFPRHSLDVALLRAYEDGKPAATPAHLRMRRSPLQAGELSFALGHPGDTDRQFTVAQLERLRDAELLDDLLYYAEQRAMLTQYARRDADTARRLRAELTFADNRVKLLRGQLAALQDPAQMGAKRSREAELRKAAGSDAAWESVAEAQRAWRRIAPARQMLEGERAFWSRHFATARDLVRAAEERGKPSEQRLPEYRDAMLPRLRQALLSQPPVYADDEVAKLTWSLTKLRETLGAEHALVKLVLRNESPEALAQRLVDKTRLGEAATRERLWDGGLEAVAQSRDPFIMLARAVDGVSRELRARAESEVDAVEARAAQTIAALRLERLGAQAYPDASGTLRLSYGELRGWEDEGGAAASTDVGGLFARHTGFTPYALPRNWLRLRDKLPASTPLNFVSSHDIAGGNSGSPVIDREARLVGVVFDGNAASLGGRFWYDARRNRAVSVHAAAMLVALEQVYGARTLVAELAPP